MLFFHWELTLQSYQKCSIWHQLLCWIYSSDYYGLPTASLWWYKDQF